MELLPSEFLLSFRYASYYLFRMAAIRPRNTPLSSHQHSHSCGHGSEVLAHTLEKIRALGMRVTAPRKAMLSLLIQEHGPFSVEDMSKRLGKGSCDQATLYRSLQQLEEAGVVRRCDFSDGVSRFEFIYPGHHHHHIICKKCRRIETLDVCLLDQLEERVRSRGYTDITHTLEFFGLCPRCRSST